MTPLPMGFYKISIENILHITRVEKMAAKPFFWRFNIKLHSFSKMKIFTTVKLKKLISY
jgi:hypothetical protein